MTGLRPPSASVAWGTWLTIPNGVANRREFPISFEPWYGVLSTCLALPPASAYVRVDDAVVHVRMGWAFRTTFPRAAVASTFTLDRRPLSRGVHGFGGRWLVNGSARGILGIQLSAAQRAYVLGVPIGLRELYVSVANPAKLADALEGRLNRP